MAPGDIDEVPLKPKSEWKYIGKFNDSVDARDKVTGAPEYSMDVSIEGMKTAIVVRSPAFKGRLVSYQKDQIMGLGEIQDLIPLIMVWL